MNNVWSKTGLRKGSQSAAGETSESETTATDKTTTDEANPEEVKDGVYQVICLLFRLFWLE